MAADDRSVSFTVLQYWLEEHKIVYFCWKNGKNFRFTVRVSDGIKQRVCKGPGSLLRTTLTKPSQT